MQQLGLWVPAEMTYAPVAALTVSALALKAGVDMDTLGDIRSAVTESMDCLIHQPAVPERVEVDASLQDRSLMLKLRALCQSDTPQSPDPAALTLSRAVLETVAAKVDIQTNEQGRVELITLSITLC